MPVESQQSMAGSSNASTMDSGSESRSASLQQLSPEMIDAIARRAVEQLSEKVVQEIAWEVVPQLAELMIKRQLEEKNS
jgi:tetrahydromethanopterin S-methyltransferase subunit E